MKKFPEPTSGQNITYNVYAFIGTQASRMKAGSFKNSNFEKNNFFWCTEMGLSICHKWKSYQVFFYTNQVFKTSEFWFTHKTCFIILLQISKSFSLKNPQVLILTFLDHLILHLELHVWALWCRAVVPNLSGLKSRHPVL